MTKLLLNRILLKDGTKLYRPLAISFERDKYSEPFVKFILPDLAKMDIEQFKGSNPLSDSSTQIGRVSKGLREFSYHYIGGVMHFKHDNLGRTQEERNVHTLSPAYIVKVLRLFIYDIQNFEAYTKTITSQDFVLSSEWSGKPRIISVFLAHTGPPINLEIVGSMPIDGLELTTDIDTDVRLLITDEELVGPYPPKVTLGVYVPNEKVVLPDKAKQ
jgi:hypothetical protein